MPSLPIFAFDLAAIVVLSYGLYFRRHRRRGLPLAYVGLNVGVRPWPRCWPRSAWGRASGSACSASCP